MSAKDKRRFRRYLKNSVVDLKLRNRSLRAQMTDYSLEGIGAIIDGTPGLSKGEVVDITVQYPSIKIFGEIMWTSVDGLNQRIGIRNVGRLKGLLRDFNLADVLIGLQRSSKTGVLSIECGDIVKKVYVSNGDMIFSTSNQAEDRLGNVLLREGRIDREQYDQSVAEMGKTGERQGSLLVRLGYLKPAELATAVRYHVEEIVLSLFGLRAGRFAFEERPLPSEEVITLHLSAANLIYYGIKKMGDLSVIESEIGHEDRLLVLSSNPLDLFQDIKLDPPGMKVVGHIDGKTSIGEIVSLTGIDRGEVLKTIYALLCSRITEFKERDEPHVEIPEKVVEEILEEKDGKATDSEVREMIEKMYRTCEDLGYYAILGVKDHASHTEIRSAYYLAARRYHPDMHFQLKDATIKDKLSRIFSSVYEAYTILSDPEHRKEYDRSLTIKPAKLTANNEKALAKFEEGKAEFRKRNYAEAALLFGQATYFDGTIADYHYYYGLALIRQNRLKDAEKAISKALSLEPYNAEYLAELGFVFLDLGLPVRARGLFERALRASPGHVRASEGLRKSARA